MSIPRKSVLGAPVDDPELMEMLENLPDTDLSDSELSQQRESFVFGNAPKDSTVTKESARHAAQHVLM